jgi:aminocarboxymuconate-semialdehyde decarboxylase
VTAWVNDMTAAMVAKYPAELDFMAYANPFEQGSIDECERCLTKLGAKGIGIVSSVNGEFLDSAQLNPFWEYAQAKEAAVFIHPPMLPIGYQKMNRYKLEEVVGRPFDTTMNIARMIYSGVFDRYPRLQVVLAHMGGGLPSVLGRLDFGYRLGYEGLPQGEAAVCKHKPSEYLRTNLSVDTMGLSPTGVQHCIDLFGVDRVLLGTDYPAVPLSPKEHIDIVRGLGLHPVDQAKILWKNADDLFKLGVTEQVSGAAAREA